MRSNSGIRCYRCDRLLVEALDGKARIRCPRCKRRHIYESIDIIAPPSVFHREAIGLATMAST